MTDIEVVAHVKRKILERDKRAVLRAEREGRSVPEWVGKD
jgi:hypothetical protein